MTQPTAPVRMPTWPVFFVAVAGAFVVALDVDRQRGLPVDRGVVPGASAATLSWALSELVTA